MKNNLKEIRAKRGISQQILADKAGLTRAHLSLIENGKKNPDGETIAKLVRALGIPAHKIFDDLNVHKEAK